MMDLNLGEITAACGGKLVLAAKDSTDTCVSCVVRDSREVSEQGVFVAITGERADGHSFISSVFAKGAALAVTQKAPKQVEEETGVSTKDWGSYLLVEDTLQALKDIAEYYRRKFSIPVVGITGSVGKTSTKEWIAGVLSEKYHVLKTEGNYNNEIGVPLTLLKIRREHTAAVVEMGISDFGEMHRLSRMVRPTVCVITNIGQCHLENLKTRDGILKAKTEIFDFMAPDAEICLNGEDDKLRTIGEVKGIKPHFFGWGGTSGEEVTAENVVSRGLWGSDATLKLTPPSEGNFSVVSGQIDVRVPLAGKHQVLNCAAAACVGRLLGLSLEQIKAGIGKVKPVGGRDQLIQTGKYTLIDSCYNANPASMKAAIDLLAMADTEKIAILGDMFELGEKSRALHEEVGAYAASAGLDKIYCVGEQSAYLYQAACASCKEPQKHASGGAPSGEAKERRPDQERPGIFYFPDKEALFAALEGDLPGCLPSGSTVLVKASHGMDFGRITEFMKSL